MPVLQVLSEKRSNLPTVEIFPGSLAEGVMPAWQPRDIKRDAVSSRFGDDIAREVNRESQIIARGDEAYGTLAHLREARDERKRANWQPVFAQLFKRQRVAESFAHVHGRKPVPDDIRDIA